MIASRVKAVIADQLERDEDIILLDDSFMDDLNVDSLQLVQLQMAIEEEFGIEIPDEDAENIIRVRELIDYVETHLP